MEPLICGRCHHVVGDDQAQEAGCRYTGQEAHWQTSCYFGPQGPDMLTSLGLEYAVQNPDQLVLIQAVWPAGMVPEVTNLVASGLMTADQALIYQG